MFYYIFCSSFDKNGLHQVDPAYTAQRQQADTFQEGNKGGGR